MTTTSDDDRGMFAVRRVRSVREQDSRLGLQQAVAERRSAGARVSALRGQLLAADSFSAGSTASFLAARSALQALGSALSDAHQHWETSRTVTEAAQSQWRQDHTRLAAIDLLLERRVAVRRAEQARGEARDLDELAMQRWLRQNPRTGGDDR